jgi:hypothetical protein
MPADPGPPPFTRAEARTFALALTYATAALAYARDHYPDFRAWCLTQPRSPDPSPARMREYETVLGEAAQLAWQHSDAQPPGRPG